MHHPFRPIGKETLPDRMIQPHSIRHPFYCRGHEDPAPGAVSLRRARHCICEYDSGALDREHHGHRSRHPLATQGKPITAFNSVRR